MDRKVKMISFPLCLLSIGKDTKEKLRIIINYCIVVLATDKFLDVTDSQVYSKSFQPSDFDPVNNLHNNILLTAKEFAVKLPSIGVALKNHEIAQMYIAQYTNRYGKDAFVQVNLSICKQVLNGAFDFYVFAVICAVSSVLGKQAQSKRITLNSVRIRMNGYKSKQVMEDIIKDPIIDEGSTSLTGSLMSLSIKKIERLRNKAEQLNFFKFYTYHRRHTYYTTRLTHAQLIEKVHDRKKYLSRLQEKKKELALEAEKQEKKLPVFMNESEQIEDYLTNLKHTTKFNYN